MSATTSYISNHIAPFAVLFCDVSASQFSSRRGIFLRNAHNSDYYNLVSESNIQRALIVDILVLRVVIIMYHKSKTVKPYAKPTILQVLF